MRQLSWLLGMFFLGAGMFFTENTARAFSEQAPFIAPDIAITATVLTSEGSLPGGVTLEAKTDGLLRVRSTLSEITRKQTVYARQVRELIDNSGEILDCETVDRTFWYDEPAALPRSPRSQRSNLDGRLRDIGLELHFSRAFATSA
ncbi:MAG: hypothetical protein V1882_03110 [Candidatus Omnitrophota bacterium]